MWQRSQPSSLQSPSLTLQHTSTQSPDQPWLQHSIQDILFQFLWVDTRTLYSITVLTSQFNHIKFFTLLDYVSLTTHMLRYYLTSFPSLTSSLSLIPFFHHLLPSFSLCLISRYFSFIKVYQSLLTNFKTYHPHRGFPDIPIKERQEPRFISHQTTSLQNSAFQYYTQTCTFS